MQTLAALKQTCSVQGTPPATQGTTELIFTSLDVDG